jgi:hypothetical protein
MRRNERLKQPLNIVRIMFDTKYICLGCKIQQFPPCGFIKNDDGEIITKHNKEIGQKRNCQKVILVTNFFV